MNIQKKYPADGMAKILTASVIFSILLVAARVWRSDSMFHVSLIWNLFLAWIPYGISVLMVRKEHWFKSPLAFYPTVFLWLLFFPNAPYIITDMFHLQARPQIPLWYDLLLIFSFAWNGLILGYLSLMKVERQIVHRAGVRVAQVFVFAVIALGAYGVFLGRFLRWNSWDFLVNPFALIWEMAEMMVHPFHFQGVWGMTLLLSILTGLMYFTLKKLAGQKP